MLFLYDFTRDASKNNFVKNLSSIQYGNSGTFLLAHWDIFGLWGIRTFSTILSFYVSNCSNISQYMYYSQKELQHFEL